MGSKSLGQNTIFVRSVFYWSLLLLFFQEKALAQLRYSIPEEVKHGSVVGNIAKDLGIDIASLIDRRFRIVSTSMDSLFGVNQSNGDLTVNGKIDREEMCSEDSACLLELKIVVENPLEIHYLVIGIADVNDNSPRFPEKEQTFEIAEHTAPGMRFKLQAARDPDAGINSVRTYTLTSNDHFEIDVRQSDDDKIPFLVLKKALDREQMSKHMLVLTAIDGGKPRRSGSVQIQVDVLDVNDNMPIFTKEVYAVNLNENSPIGTTVIQINATDLDQGSNGEILYSFGNNVDRTILELFRIDPNTGEIIVQGLLDFEMAESYDIDIKASDKGPAPFKTDKSVLVNIVDLNDNVPEIEVTSFSRAVAEDARLGTTVALISVNDLDSGLNGKVVCSLSDDIPFTLSPSTQDKMYSLVTKSPLDREKQSGYNVRIIASDSGVPMLSSEKYIHIVVSDVNDNSPTFPLSHYTFYITENNNPSASLFSVRASDPDEDSNSLISYHIPRVEREHSSFLNINHESGIIVAHKSFDFETLKTFQFHVVATDGGTNSRSSNVTVHVFILDDNDNPPVILHPLSSNGSAEGVEEVPRNVPAGHLVTKVRAYDADIGYNGWLLFSLQEVSDHSLFGLDRYTGRIRTLRSFTETDEAQHKLVILVKDNGNVSLSATATVIVKLVEPKEAISASDVKSVSKADDESNVTFYLMITLGSVSALFIASIIMLVVMQCSKPRELGAAKYLQETNYDGTLCHSIQYRSGEKRYMLVGPRMSIGSTIVPGSNGNTLVVPDRRSTSTEVRSMRY
uniref:Protocadherin 2 alpha a 15 n=1 Tax=Gadus morhua TaxID=8049 RepID=A0A8C5FKV5_GADMO